MKDPIYQQARKRVQEKKGFYTHLTVYISVGAFFLAMNILTMDPGESDKWWFFFPLLPWGVGLLIHYFSVFGLPGTDILTQKWEEQEMEKELQRLRKNEVETPEEKLDLKEVQKIKREDWSEEDLV
ncbi:MAG: 2TM domain-containing protein [Saprospiraceae bacterium]